VAPTATSEPGLNGIARISFHLTLVGTGCLQGNAIPPCENLVSTGELFPAKYHAHVLVTNGQTNGGLRSGIAGVRFGVEYLGASGTGVDILGWNLCADSETPTAGWPASDTGNIIAWDPLTACQRFEPAGFGTGVMAAAGYFYLSAYSPDALRIRTHPEELTAKVIDCQGFESTIEPHDFDLDSHLGVAGFGMEGFDSCFSIVRVQTTTWSRIKSFFRD
jgi:hypothetical protein